MAEESVAAKEPKLPEEAEEEGGEKGALMICPMIPVESLLVCQKGGKDHKLQVEGGEGRAGGGKRVWM